MKFLKKTASLVCALLCTGVMSIGVCADEPTVTEFDMSKIIGIFEMEDNGADPNNVNIIGETGVVQGGGAQTKSGTVAVNVSSTADLTLIAGQTVEITLFEGDTPIAVQRVAIGGDKISVDGMGDGTYGYKLTGAAEVLSFEETEGTCTVAGGVGSIKLSAEPVSVLYIKDSSGVAKYEFAQYDGTFSTDTYTAGFAVQQGMRYKVRKQGESDYSNIEIPAMSLEYVFDIASKQSVQLENTLAQQEAELPDENKTEDNPYNIPPTLDKDDTQISVKSVFVGVAIMLTVVIVILGAFMFVLNVQMRNYVKGLDGYSEQKSQDLSDKNG